MKSYTKIFLHIIAFRNIEKKCTLHRRHHCAIYWLSRNGDLLLSVECVLKRNIEHHPALFNVCGGRCKKRQLVLSLINVVIWFYRIFPVSFFSPCSRVTIEAIYSIDSHVEVCSVTHISFVCNSISIKSSYNYEARVDT